MPYIHIALSHTHTHTHTHHTHTHTHTLTHTQTYSDQVKAMEVQYNKLLGFSEELTSNPMVGGRGSITVETRELRSDWDVLKDNVVDSLALLQREYDDWVRV